jgi:hypothetical protein
VTAEDSGEAPRSRSGVCIVRVETEAERLLISVTTERALRRGLATAGGREMHHYVDTVDAINEVERFLKSHTPHGARASRRDVPDEEEGTDAG